AKRTQICWTLGITEHHNAVDNVLALINLALLTGHVGCYGSGVSPLRWQNNVQGGGDMGAIPDRLPGFQHVENAELRAKFEHAYRAKLDPKKGWHLSAMFEAMEHGELTTLYVLGENPIDSEADRDWGKPDAETIWNELRSLSPMHAGMTYKRLEELDGIQWPCYDESHPGEMYLHSRLWREPLIGPRAPFSVVEFEPPVAKLNEE